MLGISNKAKQRFINILLMLCLLLSNASYLRACPLGETTPQEHVAMSNQLKQGQLNATIEAKPQNQPQQIASAGHKRPSCHQQQASSTEQSSYHDQEAAEDSNPVAQDHCSQCSSSGLSALVREANTYQASMLTPTTITQPIQIVLKVPLRPPIDSPTS